MSTLFTVLSFPFWMVGIPLFLVGLFGTISVNDVPMELKESIPYRIALMTIGAILTSIAYGLVML